MSLRSGARSTVNQQGVYSITWGTTTYVPGPKYLSRRGDLPETHLNGIPDEKENPTDCLFKGAIAFCLTPSGKALLGKTTAQPANGGFSHVYVTVGGCPLDMLYSSDGRTSDPFRQNTVIQGWHIHSSETPQEESRGANITLAQGGIQTMAMWSPYTEYTHGDILYVDTPTVAEARVHAGIWAMLFPTHMPRVAVLVLRPLRQLLSAADETAPNEYLKAGQIRKRHTPTLLTIFGKITGRIIAPQGNQPGLMQAEVCIDIHHLPVGYCPVMEYAPPELMDRCGRSDVKSVVDGGKDDEVPMLIVGETEQDGQEY